MPASHFELAPAEYERRRSGHFHGRRLELVARTVQRFVPRGGTVVEVGCGPGAILADLARRHPDVTFVGVDSDEEMIRHASTAHAGPNVRFVVALVGPDPLPERASLVYAIDVLHHVHDPTAFLAAVGSGLDGGGRLLAIEPNSLHPYVFAMQERMRRAGLDEDHFRRRRWEAAFRAGGFVVETRTFLHALPASVRRVPAPIAAVERAAEHIPILAGSVVYRVRL